MSANLPEVRILPNAAAALPLLLDEVRALLRQPTPLLGFATGGTFTAFLQALAVELQQGRIAADALRATHLDEYLGFAPDRAGGMVHERTQDRPPRGPAGDAGARHVLPGAA